MLQQTTVAAIIPALNASLRAGQPSRLWLRPGTRRYCPNGRVLAIMPVLATSSLVHGRLPAAAAFLPMLKNCATCRGSAPIRPRRSERSPFASRPQRSTPTSSGSLHGSILSAPSRAELEQRMLALLPADQPGDFTQAMMDLGATICRPRKPTCTVCPLRDDCLAVRQGRRGISSSQKSARSAAQIWGCPLDRAGRTYLAHSAADEGHARRNVRTSRWGMGDEPLAGLKCHRHSSARFHPFFARSSNRDWI